MTCRILGRCARLIPRASSQASATAVRLPALAAGPTEPLQATAWQQPLGRWLCEGRRLVKEEYSVEPKRTQLDELLERAQSPQGVLEAWAAQRGNANQAAKALVQLVRLAVGDKVGARTEQSELLNDPRLLDILATVNSQVASVWNGTLVALLRAISALGVPVTAAVQRSIQTEALWRVRRLSYKQLAFLADWGAGRNDHPQEVELMCVVLKQLELRWTEIADARTVSTLMARTGHLSPALMDRLEDKALELAEGFAAEDIRRVCLSLASQGRRSVPLLRALSYHLLQKFSTNLTTPLLLDIAYAYGKLNFHHSQIFQRLAAELLPRMQDISPADVTRCCKSLAFLKWLHLPLFEAFAENYCTNSHKYSTFQLCNLVLSFARLNFQPSKGAEFYTKVLSALDGVLPSLEPFLQTDVVWSLCVLQQAKPQHITVLTQQQHITKLPCAFSTVQNQLLHITATLQLEHPESWSSTLPTGAMSLPPSLGRDSPLSPLQTGLRGALENIAGGRAEALRTGVNTVYGWTIDGELVVDSESKPIDLINLTAPHLLGGGGAKPLPNGARRLAFLTWEFPNYNSRSKDLLGRFTMMRRHLQLAGFILVEVPYYEWLELKSDWQKLAYVKDKMGKAIAEDMAK
uniref:FAST kinase domain-containing protein 4 n=1 Tax=Esox lucius TaxID=8010 RepID=A0AAY5KQJ0_ESOLU